MRIRAYGKISKQKKAFVKSLIKFSLETMIPNDPLDITVKVKFTPEDEDFRAWVLNEDYGSVQPKIFKIILPNDVTTMRLLFRTAHEVTHIKQWYLGEMREPSDDIWLWLGKEYTEDSCPYWLQPWEIEAHGRESTLTNMWIDENKFDRKTEKWFEYLT